MFHLPLLLFQHANVSIQPVDKPLAMIAAIDEKLVPIDTELGNLLEASDRLIHRHFGEFLTDILSSAKGRKKGVIISLPVRGNTQLEIGDGITTTAEQEANNDGKSLTPAIVLHSETSCRLIRKSTYSILRHIGKLFAPGLNSLNSLNSLNYQLTATHVTS